MIVVFTGALTSFSWHISSCFGNYITYSLWCIHEHYIQALNYSESSGQSSFGFTAVGTVRT